MSGPYIGEIRLFAGNFAPTGWSFCDGQVLAISENDTLFNLIGTTYGGDGQETFALPDLRSRVPIHMGNNGTSTYILGQNGGVESVTITTSQMPSHTHAIAATGTGQQQSPANAYFAVATSAFQGARTYSTAAASAPLNGGSVSSIGGSQPHSNIQPSLAVNYIISLYGIYPSPT